jgi:hypothetical protein
MGSKWKRVDGVLDTGTHTHTHTHTNTQTHKRTHTHTQTHTDTQVENPTLAAALQRKQDATFTAKELDMFGVRDLTRNSYVKIGATIWKPVCVFVCQRAYV